MESKVMHLLVVIPAYNEAAVIGGVIDSLPKKLPGISKIIPLVIDDNSHDGTDVVAKTHGALCVRHELNIGQGGAIGTGLAMAKKLKVDMVVTMDGDGQHSANDLQQLVTPIVAGKVDVVLGSRKDTMGQHMPTHRMVGNYIMNAITFVFFRLWVSDSQSGYKAFSKKALRKMRLSTSGHEVCSEIIGEIKRRNLTYCEVPIATIYTDYSRSKGQLALNAVNIILGLLLRNIK